MCIRDRVSYVREAPVADVVLAAGLKIQPPPLRGGGAVDNNQGDGSPVHQMQAFRPSAVSYTHLDVYKRQG